MIRGAVDDPLLTLDNGEIIRRHVTAYLLQRYHQDKLPTITPEEQPHLFAVLGTVADFKKSAKVLNRWDLKKWLEANEVTLRAEVDAWLPQQLAAAERKRLLDELVLKTMEPLDAAIELEPPAGVAAAPAAVSAPAPTTPTTASADPVLEVPDEEGEERPGRDPASENLPEGRAGLEAEIYIYDTLPGGAGFVKRVGDIGLPIFDDALSLLKECPDDCDRSCYRCLRSYKNKFEHDLLDRHLGASLLGFVLHNAAPTLSRDRVVRSTDLLFADLDRQDIEGLSLERDKKISIAGFGDVVAPILVTKSTGARFAIGLHGPLTPDEPTDADLKDIKEYATSLTVLLEDELVVRRNLPFATQKLIEKLG